MLLHHIGVVFLLPALHLFCCSVSSSPNKPQNKMNKEREQIFEKFKGARAKFMKIPAFSHERNEFCAHDFGQEQFPLSVRKAAQITRSSILFPNFNRFESNNGKMEWMYENLKKKASIPLRRCRLHRPHFSLLILLGKRGQIIRVRYHALVADR
jgi:hypothetical protein